MASGSNYLTTYYAKRIIGDTAAATSTAALLQTGSGITTNTWILHRTNRASTYGIHYLYDSTANGTADKIEFYGGQRDTDDTMDVASAWIQLDTGDASFNDIIGNGTLTINSTSILYGNVVIGSTNPTANLLVYGNIQGKDDLQLFLDAAGRIASGNGPDPSVNRSISFIGTDDAVVANITTEIKTNKDHQLQFTLLDNAGNEQNFILYKAAPNGNTAQNLYIQWSGLINNSIFPKTTAGYDLGLRTNIWGSLWLRSSIKQIGTANAVKSSAIANNTSHLHFQDLEDINAINNHSGTPTESNRIFSIGSNFTVASSITTTYSYIRTYNWKNNSTENTYIRLSITNASTPTRHVYVNSSFEADGSIYSGTTDHESTHSIVARSKSGTISIYSDYIASTSNYSRGLYFGPNTIDDTTYAGYAAIASATDNTTTFRLYNANVNKYTTIIADGKDDYEGMTYGNRQWTIPMANGNRIFVGTHPDNYPYNSMGVVYAVNGGSNDSTYVLTTPRVKLYNHIQIATSRNNTNVDIRVTGLVIYGSCYGNTAAHLVSNTAGVFRYMDGGPQLIFASGNADPFGAAADQPQIGALIFTDHDQAGTGVSFHFVSNQSSDNNGGNLTVTAPRFRARKGLTIGQNTDNTSYTLYVNGTITATNTIYANGGYLKSTMNSNTVTIGSQNGSWCHFENSANIPFYFGKDIHVNSQLIIYNTNTKLYNNYLTFAQGGGWYMSDTSWVRTYNNKSVYSGSGTIRSDGNVWGCKVRLTSNWVGFYNGNGDDTTRYGYVQANADRMYFRKENGASNNIEFDFNGEIYTSGEYITNAANGLRIKNMILRNDTSDVYFLIASNSNTPGDNWNTLRPFAFKLSTGIVTMGNGLRIVNDSSNTGDDALVYIQNQTANDWALKIAKGGKNYGIRVDSLDQGEAIWTNGYVRARCVWANQGSNGERQVGTDSSTSGNIYFYSHTTAKGIYSGSGYSTGAILTINSSGKTFYGSLSGNASSATTSSKVTIAAGAGSTLYPLALVGSYSASAQSIYVSQNVKASNTALYTSGTFQVGPNDQAYHWVMGGGGSYAWCDVRNASNTVLQNIVVYSTYMQFREIRANAVKNAVWNDYAEYRLAETEEPGRVVIPYSDKVARLSNARLQAGGRIISDTYGNVVGQNDIAKTPVGLAGRVLAYPYRDKSEYNIGDAVCSAPNGTVDIMTRDEIMMYPERILGIVNEIPDYETWESTLTYEGGLGKNTQRVAVKGRIWIDIK